MKYIKQLIVNATQALSAKPTREFQLQSLDDLNGIQQAVYVIEEIEGEIDQTFQDFMNFKKKSTDRACSKLNSPSSVMYVGSSMTGVKSRIKQHLGEGPKKTYALHLSHWFKGKHRIRILVYDVSAPVLQIIEDALSYELEPAFGKRGGNNK